MINQLETNDPNYRSLLLWGVQKELASSCITQKMQLFGKYLNGNLVTGSDPMQTRKTADICSSRPYS